MKIKGIIKRIGIMLLLAPFALQAMPVTVTSNHIESLSYDNGTWISDSTNNTSIPFSAILSATSGNSSSVTDVDWTGGDNFVLFDASFNHNINNSDDTTGGFDYAQTYQSTIAFSTNDDSAYALSGLYDFNISNGGRSYYDVYLRDDTQGIDLFRDTTLSTTGGDLSQIFNLGVGGDGNTYNITLGSLTGNLIAGNNYSFYFETNIITLHDQLNTQGAGVASGNVALLIGDPSLVPEPMSFALMILGLFALGQRPFTRNR